ncbi:M1 family metallopeptidase [Flammeovirgaceae bacterium SG7u.111]|nr:M1 family metallopeptidase [Flammeovirgaceae bacterium SG7u.132]WPO38478.1 M1 family metallopeptidase [Flammeovirgaceae bacterium SG7u.111]
MKKTILLASIFIGLIATAFAQGGKHTDKFEQLGPDLGTPNEYRTASGAPGVKYWQNTADFDMEIVLDDEKQTISGVETITYHNESPDVLTYLWMQLDQNMRAKDSHTYSTATNSVNHGATYKPQRRSTGAIAYMMEPEFEGGFKIEYVTDMDGNPLPHVINKTMMSVDMPKPLKTGESFSYKVAWSYNINDRMKIGGRSGYEYFEKDDNYLYTIAQFFPRMCVYSDNEGWQNKQFLGSGEFTLPFGDYKFKLTVPADHVVAATGKLANAEEVLSEKEIERLKKAETSDTPVIIVTQKEAEKAEKKKVKETKTWVFEAENVRDFAFATSRKFIWDAMGIEIGGKTVMAMSYYPKEGNPLWEEYSTRAVAQALETYSHYTIDYPYHKAISVHTDRIGMEYPMICFNGGRPDEDGTYSDRVKYGMIGVIIHEVGHNFFPMIINSDERQWTWMDEGLNTFTQYLTELDWQAKNPKEADYPHRRGPANNIVPYMKMDKSSISPIMTNSEQVQMLGPNAYAKPATALNILRETVMGKELFDRAFKEYAQRWAFKHPTPADFFRTMEDASGVDLDWFWKGWFYTVDHTDIAMTGVKKLKISTDTTAKSKKLVDSETADEDFQEFYANLSEDDMKKIDPDLKFYEVSLENLGGLVMPVILEFTYKDGSTEIKRIPAEIWRKNSEKITKVFTSTKDIESIVLDPFLETADTDLENNYWPKKELPSRFELFKESGGK